jgi:cell division septation protein DedD
MSSATFTLTRGHLLALGATSLTLAALTFLLGIEVGRQGGEAPPPPEPAGLVPKEVAEGQMEELISKVEASRGQPLDFPSAIVAPPAAGADGVPSSGWAIQVQAFPDEAGAQVLVEKLRAAGLPAYRISAVVEGHPEHRVRVAGFGSKDAASAELGRVAKAAEVSEGVVVPAP